MFATYAWEWNNKKVQIRTFQGLGAAIGKAIAYFPDDTEAADYLQTTPPVITNDDGEVIQPTTDVVQ